MLKTPNKYFAEKELQILTELNNVPGIVKLIGTFVENDNRILVMPKLKPFNYNEHCNSLTNIQNVIKQLLQTLDCMHSKKIAHLDINPSNICESNGKIYFIDFGFARRVDGKEHPYKGTKGYIAPELDYGGGITTACDIYSVGIIFGGLLAQFIKDRELNILLLPSKKIQLIDKINLLKKTFPSLSLQDAFDLLQKMIDPNEDSRITANNCLKAQFMLSNIIESGEGTPLQDITNIGKPPKTKFNEHEYINISAQTANSNNVKV